MWRAEKKGKKNGCEKIEGSRMMGEERKGEQGDQAELQNQRNQGRWSPEEQLQYIMFLQIHRKLFQTSKKRKENRIFKMMSDFIQTRDFIQCRSHHMKQLRAHNEKIRNIILSFKKCCDLEYYSTMLHKFQPLSNVVYKTTQEIQPQNEDLIFEEPKLILPKADPVEIEDQERNIGSVKQTNKQQEEPQNVDEDPNNSAWFWVFLFIGPLIEAEQHSLDHYSLFLKIYNLIISKIMNEVKFQLICNCFAYWSSQLRVGAVGQIRGQALYLICFDQIAILKRENKFPNQFFQRGLTSLPEIPLNHSFLSTISTLLAKINEC